MEFALNYLDDIMILLSTWEEHLKHIKAFFKWFEAANLKLKCGKCEFFKTKVYYLGFIVGVYGIQPLSKKVAAIQALQLPKDINGLRQILGLAGFYRKCIPCFADISICLNRMLRRGATFDWTKQCENALKCLKEELTKMPALQYPNPNKPFQLFTDASKHNYSGILHLEKEGQPNTGEPELIPTAYFSGTFNKTQQLWNNTQKECYPAYKSVQKFFFYLTGIDCTLYCNHKPLTPFFMTGMSSHVLDQWALELQQFNVKSEPIQVKKNMVADVIARLRIYGLYQDNNNEEVQLSLEDAVENIIEEIHNINCASTTTTYNKLDKLNLNLLQREQQGDSFCKKKVKEINTTQDPNFILDDSSILRKAVKVFSCTHHCSP